VEGKLERRQKSPHFMCGKPFWGVAGAVVSLYYAYWAYSHVRNGDFDWEHEWWAVLTCAVWALFMAGLFSEVRCRRERTFFGVVFVVFLLGFVLSAWTSAPESTVRQAREVASALWVLAAAASLTTTFAPKGSEGSRTQE